MSFRASGQNKHQRISLSFKGHLEDVRLPYLRHGFLSGGIDKIEVVLAWAALKLNLNG
jgi:hypothetical protein